MKYDLDALYSEAGGEEFSAGKRRFYDNKVSEINGHFFDGKFTIEGKVKGHSEYLTKVVFDETGGLYDYACSCDVFSMSSGPCKHILASALAYENKFPQASNKAINSGNKVSLTDAVALTLATDYSKRKNKRYMGSDEEKVSLTPILCFKDNDKLALRFLIGRNKIYTLKDISDFVSALLSLGKRRYGVELEIEHYIENFNEKSQKLIKFLIGSYNEKVEISKEKGSNIFVYRDELPLIGGDVDDFMQLYEGQLVQFDDRTMRDGYRLIEKGGAIPCNIIVSESDDGYVISNDFPKFNIITGKSLCYILTDSRVYSVSPDYIVTMMPLLKAINLHKKITVSKNDMALFYNSVLVSVAKYVPIVAEGIDLAAYEAAPFLAKIYINSLDFSISASLTCSYDDTEVDIFNDNEMKDLVRDWETEAELRKILSHYFPVPRLELSDEYDIYNFMSTGVKELFDYADIFLAEDVKKMRVKKPPRIKVGVRLESDLLKVDLNAEEYTENELYEILSAYREKRNYVRLSDGSFVDLIDPSIRSAAEIFDVAETNSQGFVLPKYYAPFLDSELKEGFFSLERNSEFKDLIKNLNQAANLDIPVPPSLKDIMRNYQKAGFRWLKTLTKYGFGGILADDMGLGKSLQVIALLESEKKGTSIIICPTTLILNWVNEFEKFAPHIKILAVMGSFEERKAKTDNAEDYDVVITSFELMRRDEEFYKDINFNFAIVDEAQYIKNPQTKNAKAAKTLRAQHRFALTGTPVENSLAELWSIFDFIMPGYLYSYAVFKERYELGVVHGDEEATRKLKKLVSPFILRRLKSTVLTELPPKIESIVESNLEGEQKQLYYANLSLIKDSVKEAGATVNKIVVLSMLTKLRQICCEPSLVYPGYKGNSAKLDTCMEILDEAVESGHKVLLFSQFTSMLDIIRLKLIEKGITYYLLKGDTAKTERMRLVTKFNADDTKVFLISLKAGGTGLNLTGADVVIHFDPWWNESVMNQATDRAYRMGQDKSVQVYKLIVKNSIEQKILSLQERKTALSSLIVGGTSKAQMSYEDILEILKE